MRLARTMAALLLIAAAVRASAESYRDDLALPSYRLLRAMLAQLRDGTPLERASRSLELAAPLVRSLDQRYGADLERALRRAIASDDRDAAFAATTLLVLVDTQDLLEGIRSDDYTGWTDAKVRTKKAFLNYGLVAEDQRREQPALDRRLVADFAHLALVCHDSDMTTPPEKVYAARDAVVASLVAMRGALGQRRPDHGRGRGG